MTYGSNMSNLPVENEEMRSRDIIPVLDRIGLTWKTPSDPRFCSRLCASTMVIIIVRILITIRTCKGMGFESTYSSP